MAKNLLQNSCDLNPVAPTVSGTASVKSPQGLVLVRETVANGSTSVTFSNLANYPYTNYKLIINNGSSTTSYIYITLSTNNGSSFITGSGYQSGFPYITYNANSFSAAPITGAFIITLNAQLTSFSVDVDLYNINNTSTAYVCVSGYSTGYNASAGVSVAGLITGTYLTQIIANAIQVGANSGTFSGSFYLYGRNG